MEYKLEVPCALRCVLEHLNILKITKVVEMNQTNGTKKLGIILDKI